MNTFCSNYQERQKIITWQTSGLPLSLCLAVSIVLVLCERTGAQPSPSRASIPNLVMLKIVSAEDERRWDTDLQTLLVDKNAAVRRRTALAAGRIGDERAVPALIS